ncbi:hypothetical protein D3C75_397550 [compost metagenome]
MNKYFVITCITLIAFFLIISGCIIGTNRNVGDKNSTIASANNQKINSNQISIAATSTVDSDLNLTQLEESGFTIIQD